MNPQQQAGQPQPGQAQTPIAPSATVGTSVGMTTTASTRSFADPTGGKISSASLDAVRDLTGIISEGFAKRIVGQENLKLALLVSMLTGGHILLESVPGLAKTTAAQTVATIINGSFKRIQCTPDLLPSDIIGTQIYDYAKGEFKTQLGPVHANFVLLDEINRSSAKTQSAMLEAMQEKQTSIGGVKYPLPQPFVVIATQNPIEQEGTYELPEAQLDRFLLKEILDYPTPAEELTVLKRIESGVLADSSDLSDITRASLDQVVAAQTLLNDVYIDDAIKNYIVQIVSATRQPSAVIGENLGHYVQYGASPRASIAFQQASKAVALISGRGYVVPEDVKQLRYSILRHRIILNFEAVADQVHAEAIIDALFNTIVTP